jgi:tetratricopeptide (TPR) repeat protein
MNKYVLIVILIAISGISLYSQDNSKDLITTSYNAESDKNYVLALEKMKALEMQDNNDAFYKLRIGWLLYLSGKYIESLSYYQESQKLNPSTDAKIGSVNCYVYLGLWNDAIKASSDILQSYPDNTDVLLKAGYAAFMKRDYNQAIDYYERVLSVNPYNFEATGYLLPAYFYSGNTIEARKHYQFLKKYYPESQSVKDFAQVLE